MNPDIHIKIQNDFKQDSMQELMCWDDHSDGHDGSNSEIVCTSCHLISSKKQKYFEEVENAASEIMYRCLHCKKCQKCCGYYVYWWRTRSSWSF